MPRPHPGILRLCRCGIPAQTTCATDSSYIHDAWHTLTRSTNECASLVDPKLRNPSRVLYLPHGMKVPASVARLRDQCAVQIKVLPRSITRLGQINPTESSGAGPALLAQSLRRPRRTLQ